MYFWQMESAYLRLLDSCRLSMRSFVRGLTFHAQVRTVFMLSARLYSLAILSPCGIRMILIHHGVVFADRFWMIPVSESAVLLSAFLERFESALVLEQQLPAMKPQQLQVMVRACLTCTSTELTVPQIFCQCDLIFVTTLCFQG